ncbi:uncharacterized protein A4U43_C07F32520 [Asparagus officinalis]|uniref:Uncharacterized protein n=1 Tax=Asparagus officinalis TaxID=4686 RepID=A0A5P1EGI1_ASPOF|nr:uncharacterized protein A4U43_C07F32520 [Asparagus officinalis]
MEEIQAFLIGDYDDEELTLSNAKVEADVEATQGSSEFVTKPPSSARAEVSAPARDLKGCPCCRLKEAKDAKNKLFRTLKSNKI